MRSFKPIPHDPWPRNMVIRVEDDSDALLSPLWVREAWRLKPEGPDLPPELIESPVLVPETDRNLAPITEWQAAWADLWTRSLSHAASPRDPAAFAMLETEVLGSAERERLIRELSGPHWIDSFGPDALKQGEREWRSALIHRHLQPMVHGTAPERSSLDALIPAWRAGLTTIVQLPCRGSYTRVIGRNALVVTIETRSDPARFSDALGTFR